MAGLTRYTQQLFASTGLTGTGGFGAAANGVTATEVATSNNPLNIMAGTVGAWAGGWLSAVLGASKFPAIEDMNAKDYAFSYQIGYILERGIPEYDSGTSYNIGDVAKGVGNTYLFSSLTDSNSGNALPTPPASNANWRFCGDLANIGTTNVFAGGTTTGSANAQTLASVSPSSGLTPSNGQTVIFTAGFTNTNATTLAITAPSIAATAINKDSGSGLIALVGGEIVAGDTIYVTWNSTSSVWVLSAGLPIGTAASKTASDNTKTNVASVSGATVIDNIATFADTAGTVKDSGFPRLVLQQVRLETGASATGTTIMPYDNTIPQNTEGDQYMSLAITPKSATSILVIEVCFNGAISTGNDLSVALFQDSVANALAAAATANAFTSGLPVQVGFKHKMTSGTTSATTFKVRAGPSSAATVTFNGSAGAGIFGGVMASSIIITEYSS